MAFIVEMFNGKSDNIEFMGLDAEGELFVERVIQNGEPDPERREFRCSMYNWDKALKLGSEMGWKPTGTVLESTFESSQPEISDYEPSSFCEHCKVFLANDAAAYAEALEKAIDLMNEFELKKYSGKSHTIINSTMNAADYANINQDLSKDFLLKFTRFLRKGKFSFLYDD